MIYPQQHVPNYLKSSQRCSAKALCCCQSARPTLGNHKYTPQQSSCASKRRRKGNVLTGHQIKCSAGSEQPSNGKTVVSELALLIARLDPEVRNVLPKDVPLDMRFEEPRPAKDLLNIQLFGAQPTLAGLWKTAKTKAQDEIVNLYPILTLSADTKAGSIRSATIFEFCHRLHGQYSDAGMYVDHYILLCSCLELIWSENAHETVRSMMCAKLLCDLSFLACKIQKQSADVNQRPTWCKRSVRAAQLGISIFAQFRKVPEAEFLDPLPIGVPAISAPGWTSLPSFLSNNEVLDAQACAAHCAAETSYLLGQDQLAASFFNMALLLSERLKLTANVSDGRALQLYGTLVLDLGALQNFSKPGGYSVAQALDMALRAETLSHPLQARLSEAVQQELKKHDAWSQDLKLRLQRSWMVYQGSGVDSDEWVSASQEVHAVMQNKPNNFQVSLDVFPESVFQDASEWFDVACWSQVKPLAHEVIASKAMMLWKQQQYDGAFELTLSGASGDVMEAEHYALVMLELLPSYSKLQPSSSPVLYGWELTLAFARFCRNANDQLARSASPYIKIWTELFTTNPRHRLFLYNCAEILCHKEGLATHADYFSECLTIGMTEGGNNAQDDRNHKHLFFTWMVLESIIVVSAKAAATMVSWLHLREDGRASLALLATHKVNPPVAKSWEHLVMVLCKAQQASEALAALQQLSYMGTLPSRAVAEVFKVLVNLADVKDACVQRDVSSDTCIRLLSSARPVAPPVASAKSKGFQSTPAMPPPDAEGNFVVSQPPTNLGQPDHARVAWDLFQYAGSAGLDLNFPAVEGLWESQVCEGFEENLAELADSEVFVEIMPITAMRCLFKHCMSMDGGGVDSAMSIRIALLMAVKFPSGDSNQAAKKAFDVARKAEQLMDNLSTSRGIPNGSGVDTLACILNALHFEVQAEAEWATEVVDGLSPPSQELQLLLVSKLCSEGDVCLALGRLQMYHQQVANMQSCFERVFTRLTSMQDMGFALDTLAATPAGAAVFSGLIEACDNSNVSHAKVSWLLYERACHLSLTLSSRAQAVLWKHQTGAKLLQLYHEWMTGSVVVAAPSPDQLEAVAIQFASQCKWALAMAIGADLAGQQQHVQAAQIACTVMKGVHGHSSDASLLYQALPWLSVAGKHREAVQVYDLMMADASYTINAGSLALVVRAFLSLGQHQDAYQTLERHSTLARTMNQPQASDVMTDTVKQLKPKANFHWSLVNIVLFCLQQMPEAADQDGHVSEVVHVCLARGGTKLAFDVALAAAQHKPVPLSISLAILKSSLQDDARKLAQVQGSSLSLSSNAESAVTASPQSTATTVSNLPAQPLSQLTSDLFHLCEQQTSLDRPLGGLLDTKSASVLAELWLRAHRWDIVIAIFEQRKAIDQLQGIDKQLWNAAMMAHMAVNSQPGLSETWHWAHQNGCGWRVTDPECYICIAQALACEASKAMQGAELLLAYAAQKYSVPLPVAACNAFLHACTGPSTDRKAGTIAALALLHGMHAPLPAPNLKTFSAVTLCILAHLDDGMPAYQLLVQLHEQVLPQLHGQLGTGPPAAKVYQAAMAAFNPPDAQTSQRMHAPSVIQTVMLMAQHGMAGLTARGCELLLEAVDDYNEQWLRSTFGDAFLDEVEAVFIGDKVLTSSLELVMFPALPVPALVVRKLDTQRAYLNFAEGDMPDFMVPPEAWPTYHMRLQSQEVQEAPSEEVNAAQLLQQQYGHLLPKDGSHR